MDLVRSHLRQRLQQLGYEVGSDSHGLSPAIYIWGAGDRAAALFEFQPSAGVACDTMYQGSWGEGLPPRFAVLPSSESTSTELDMLSQTRVVPLFFDRAYGQTELHGLESLLAEHLSPM